MLLTPFYDPEKSYEENYKKGPFGDFANGKVFKNEEEAKYNFLGFKVNSPFGIPAGPLINGNFMQAAFEKSFNICVYKTVRTREKKCNDWPNVLPVKVEGDLTMEKARQGLITKKQFTEPLAITNSFGNPSYDPKIWQADIVELVKWVNKRKGQVVCGMIEGTRWSADFTEQDFLNDWVLAARLMNETKVHVIEANFSCPNEGNEVKRLLCFDIEQSFRIVEAIKKEIGRTPLIIKIPYFENEIELQEMVQKLGNVVDGFSAINTIPSTIQDEKGNQALPGGEWRLRSGVCGAPIKWAGLEMVRRLKKLREEFGYSYTIIGVGGVTTSEDFFEYRKAGADVVMSATGAMWNPYLAQEIAERLKKS
ncbi:dihydroorotate oxidase [Patescibacteria group bacterium]|nr:dihydroorotate oxidase [Patescibacteria group bacterium]